MEIFKEEVFKSTYFYSREEGVVDESILLVGRNGFDEYRGILEIDTFKIIQCCIDEDNVLKIELNLYLGEAQFESNVNEYGIEICRNIEVFDLDGINFSNFPKFNQSYAMYNLKKDFEGKFVKFDVTHLKKFFFSEERIGFTILGLGARGLVSFCKDERRVPYLKFECEKVNKSPKIALDRYERSVYGFFISDEVETVAIKNYRAIKWSKVIESRDVLVCENKYEIEILSEGVYSVDYFLNIRSESEGYMFLKVDSMELDYSFVRTTFDEHGYVGKVIIKCKKGSKIALCLLGKGLLIQEFGGVGNIKIIKI
ncbi:MAG: hypothetical protein ACRC28_06500 [Clostridium sp.]|uniref:hypothetical protein n=1 Tax=Clostridium sp. TaxID=1506 RepID=UPI003F2C269A